MKIPGRVGKRISSSGLAIFFKMKHRNFSLRKKQAVNIEKIYPKETSHLKKVLFLYIYITAMSLLLLLREKQGQNYNN